MLLVGRRAVVTSSASRLGSQRDATGFTVAGLRIFNASSTLGVSPQSPAKMRRSTLLKIGRFGDLRRNTLS